jgi:OOP family OmpA-OmpF porin
MKKLRLVCLASLAALGSTHAIAQNNEHFYGGLSVGQAQSKINTDGINASLIGAGASTTSLSHDNKDGSYKVFGGYQINPNFAVEAGYFNLGEFGFKSTTNPTGSLDGRFKIDGMNVDLVGTMPVNNQLSLMGRVGMHNARTRDTFRGTGAMAARNANPDDRDTNYKAGFGFSYKFSESISLRGELERYRVSDAVGSKANINVASLSLVFPFGRTPAPAPKVVDRVVYEDRPVVVVVPPIETPPTKPENLRVSFNADVLFGFDRATVTPLGKRALDKFATELNGVAYDHITIEGHTDRIGKQVYNEKLSLQRADAVKTYLVSLGTITANKVTTVGKGSSEPMTNVGECKGIQTSKEVIACLEPDRRVKIDVSGTKPANK